MKNWFRFSMLAIQIAGLLSKFPTVPSEYGFGRHFLKMTRHSKSKT